MVRLTKIWVSRSLSWEMKFTYTSLVVPIVLYRFKMGTLSTETEKRIQAFEMKYF